MRKRFLIGTFCILITFTLITPVSAEVIPTHSFGPIIEKDATFTWKITDLEHENGSTSWNWTYLGEVLSENDEITYKWNKVPDIYTPQEMWKADSITGPLDGSTRGAYDITVTIGGTTLDINETRAIAWFILPVYLNTTLFLAYPGIGTGFGGIEYLWPYSFILPNGPIGYSPDGKHYDWTVDMDSETASMDSIGFDAEAGDEVIAWVKALVAFDDYYAFDLKYDACSGVLKSLRYPSTIPQENVSGIMQPARADNTTGLTMDLAKLHIDLQTDITGCNASAWSTTEIRDGAAPGFDLFIVAGSLVLVTTALIISRRRK
ncbi:MAG: hypothetical protein ACFE9L_01240 [Candidatus Hodarchaeota archaeon]